MLTFSQIISKQKKWINYSQGLLCTVVFSKLNANKDNTVPSPPPKKKKLDNTWKKVVVVVCYHRNNSVYLEENDKKFQIYMISSQFST